MQKKLYTALAAAAGLALLPALLCAQVEKLPSELLKADQASLSELQKSAKGDLASHLKRMMQNPDLKAASNAARIARDIAGKDVANFVYYSVPATSANPYLPNVYPVDGVALKQVRIISAQDEYEPGSFLVYALKDLGKVQLSLSEFKTKDGSVFPANALDLKFVKVWYQNRNAWTNYFGDTELALIPELLLNDEDLIKTDEKNIQNYAKLKEEDGRIHYQWISPPMEIDRRFDEHWRNNSIFMPMKKNFRDAKTLQPVNLPEGVFKQFFLTAHTVKDQKPGLYKGTIRLTSANGQALGEIPVAIRVLPFVLPSPKTYADVTKDYLTASYNYTSIDLICQENGGDAELAWKQLDAVIRNLREHNQTMHWLRGLGPDDPEFRRTIELLKKNDMDMKHIIGGGAKGGLEARLDAKLKHDWYMKNLGHTNVFIGHGDEPPAQWVQSQRPLYRAYQAQGHKFIIAGREQVLFKAGYLYDFFNTACMPENRGEIRRWAEVGQAQGMAWYSGHHTGPEDPNFNRRQYGLAAYLAGFTATCNYAHHFGSWNDRSTTYRPMVFAYGIYDGVVDTIQWEGFREGIDDIRYATLMKTLALEAAESKDVDVRYAGRQAQLFLATQAPETIDLASARLEMTKHILNLKKMLNK